MKIIISITLMLTTLCGILAAQSKVNVKGGADMVSSYIWRGSYNAGASIQPKLEAELAGFILGTWGSVDVVGQERKEVDIYINYTFNGFTIGLTDYWWEGEGIYNYLHYAKGESTHRFEAKLLYQLPIEKFPISISWNTIFAGNDYTDNGKRNYSTYIELIYPFSASKQVDMAAFIGATPWYSPSILPSKNQNFAVCNVGISAQYAIKCSDKFAIPIFSQLILNPAKEDIHIVFGVSLQFGS